jgi:hypothetical protein
LLAGNYLPKFELRTPNLGGTFQKNGQKINLISSIMVTDEIQGSFQIEAMPKNFSLQT